MGVPKAIQDRLDIISTFKFTNEELKTLSCNDVAEFYNEMSEAIRRVEERYNVFIRQKKRESYNVM